MLVPKRLIEYALAVSVGFAVIVTTYQDPIAADFAPYYVAGRMVLEGYGHRLYDVPLQRQLHSAAHAGSEFLPFIAPPYAAWIFAPFALLPFAWSYAVFSAVSLLALAQAIRVSLRGGRRGVPVATLFLVVVMFLPVWRCLSLGQLSCGIALILAYFHAALRQRRDFSAGMWLGSMLFKPQLVLPLALLLVAQRRWRAVLGTSLIGLAWAVLCVPLAGAVEAYAGHLAWAREVNRGRAMYFSVFESTTFLLDWLSPALATSVGYALTLAGMAFLISMWNRCGWIPESIAWRLRMAATFTASLALSLHLVSYDLTVWLVAFVLALTCFDQPPLGVRLASIGVLVAGLLAEYLGWLQAWAATALGAQRLAGLQVGPWALLLWAVVVWRAANDTSDGQIAGPSGSAAMSQP